MSDIKPYEYEDWSGDQLQLIRDDGGDVSVAAHGTSGETIRVDIAAEDVRKVTSAMHEQAGLPDRWTLLREGIEADIDAWGEAAQEYAAHVRTGTPADKDSEEGRKRCEAKRVAARAVLARMNEIGEGR